MKMIYQEPQPVLDQEAVDAIAKDDIERLRILPIQLGFNHENWRFIQDVCVRLSEHRDPWVRSNSLLGLSYAARFRGRVEKNIVKPVLLRALRDEDARVASVARDAIDDINRLMRWRIGGAKKRKEAEARSIWSPERSGMRKTWNASRHSLLRARSLSHLWWEARHLRGVSNLPYVCPACEQCLSECQHEA